MVEVGVWQEAALHKVMMSLNGEVTSCIVLSALCNAMASVLEGSTFQHDIIVVPTGCKSIDSPSSLVIN